MLPFLIPILSALASNGLGVLAKAVEVKGIEVIESTLGIKLPSSVAQLTPEKLVELKQKEMEHEEFLILSNIEAATLQIEADKSASIEITKRWQADMLSDSFLSKNIRPLMLISLLAIFALFSFLSIWDMVVDAAYVSIFGDLLKTAFGAYFVGRTVEKAIDIHNGWKETKGE